MRCSSIPPTAYMLGLILLHCVVTVFGSAKHTCTNPVLEVLEDEDTTQLLQRTASWHELHVSDHRAAKDPAPVFHAAANPAKDHEVLPKVSSSLFYQTSSMTSLHLAAHFNAQHGIAAIVLFAVLVVLKAMYPTSGVIRAVSLSSCYILASTVMIESNKWLMQATHYPYPLTMTAGHMLVSTVLANVLRFFCPSAFPALATIDINWRFCLKFLPIGAFFALSIVCGNAAYQHLSVAFLQIMKESNIAVVYCLSVVVGLESLLRCSVTLLVITLFGAVLAVLNEMHFDMIGFLIQLTSSLSEASKVVIQGVLMSGSAKLDPLTMVLFMAPACLLIISIPMLISDAHRLPEIATHLQIYWPIIALNACLAFVLNVIVAQCIKHLSPIGFLLAGVVKDIAIILISTAFLGESLTIQQDIGFCIALIGVGLYSVYKQNIDCFTDDRLLPGFRRLLFAEFAADTGIKAEASGDNTRIPEVAKDLEHPESSTTWNDVSPPSVSS
eukprot:TRINITY_DN7499_c0_g1_i2.p1 TRINITY_DN7499_c0_g1~~TRINITY_DN7499_c0_g1_i2.p1  ORF type:complete len:498 (-),score=65.07 TRINITY_DN7499_c0_g1_i2:374-1867(-)